jgi:hypothetical protein
MTQRKFKVKLAGQTGSEVAAPQPRGTNGNFWKCENPSPALSFSRITGIL